MNENVGVTVVQLPYHSKSELGLNFIISLHNVLLVFFVFHWCSFFLFFAGH